MCRIKWKTNTRKTLRPFFFFREKRNKKTLPLPPQQVGVLLSCQRLKIRKGQVVFFCKNHSKKSPPLNPCKLSFCPIFREYRKPYSANKKIYSSFGVKFYRTKPLNKKRHENNLSYLLYLIYIFFSNKLPVYFFHFVICQKSFFHFQIFFIAPGVHNRIDIFR